MRTKVARVRKEFFAEKDLKKTFALESALHFLKEMPQANFLESVEIALRLGIDPKRSDQSVRGAVVMPNGTGKQVRVAVFASGEAAEQAKLAGADRVGLQDLIDDILAGDLPYDLIISMPEHMPKVGRLGQILGPKGLMPNPKLGTVAVDVEKAVRNAKSGQINFRSDKSGIIHAGVGKINFSVEALVENIRSLISAVRRLKPAASKGVFIQRAHLSTTMGPGLTIAVSTLE